MTRYRTMLISALLLGMVLGSPAGATENRSQEDKQAAGAHSERAIVAGGCFWCMEPPFEKLEGVSAVISGYTGGAKKNPTYKEVSAGGTGHTEAVEILFDPAKISYKEILYIFWRVIDPTDAAGQFVDRGSQYRPGIYPLDEEQMRLAQESKRDLEALDRFSKPIVVEIVPATRFYPAEEYHQDYYKKNPLRYRYYRYGSGRDQYLDEVWGEGRKY